MWTTKPVFAVLAPGAYKTGLTADLFYSALASCVPRASSIRHREYRRTRTRDGAVITEGSAVRCIVSTQCSAPVVEGGCVSYREEVQTSHAAIECVDSFDEACAVEHTELVVDEGPVLVFEICRHDDGGTSFALSARSEKVDEEVRRRLWSLLQA